MDQYPIQRVPCLTQASGPPCSRTGEPVTEDGSFQGVLWVTFHKPSALTHSLTSHTRTLPTPCWNSEPPDNSGPTRSGRRRKNTRHKLTVQLLFSVKGDRQSEIIRNPLCRGGDGESKIAFNVMKSEWDDETKLRLSNGLSPPPCCLPQSDKRNACGPKANSVTVLLQNAISQLLSDYFKLHSPLCQI